MIRQIDIADGHVILGRNGSALVSSKSQPGYWHCVKNGTCDCKGFNAYDRCRHVRVVAELTGQPIATLNPTFALYAKTVTGTFDGRKQREEVNLTEVAAGEAISFVEWRERHAS